MTAEEMSMQQEMWDRQTAELESTISPEAKLMAKSMVELAMKVAFK